MGSHLGKCNSLPTHWEEGQSHFPTHGMGNGIPFGNPIGFGEV